MIYRSPEIERLALAIHDGAHENLRCEYRCEFWHSLGVALGRLMPDDLASAGVSFAIQPSEVRP